jgi:hypothetical protein
MRLLALTVAVLACVAFGAYSLYTAVWAAFFNPGRHASGAAVYWPSVVFLAVLGGAALRVGWRVIRHLRTVRTGVSS